MIPGSAHPLLRSGGGHWKTHYKIGYSVRLRASVLGHFSRAFGAPTNRDKWTWAGWVRRARKGWHDGLFGGPTTADWFGFHPANDSFYVSLGAAQTLISTSVAWRDPTDHYFVLVSYDANNATPSQRCRVFIFDQELTSWTTDNRASITPGYSGINTAATHYLGTTANVAGTATDGNLSEYRFIDGLALLPSDFIRRCPEKGHWEPIKYTGAYGNNGSYQDFSDGSAATSASLGKDRSGNNNDWTPSNISVAAGVTCDWLSDSPTNRFPTWNPFDKGPDTNAPTDGNLKVTWAGALGHSIRATHAFPRSGQWKCELTNAYQINFGIIPTRGANLSLGVGYAGNGYGYRGTDGQKHLNGVMSAYGAAFNTTDIITLLYDPTNLTLEFKKNNVSQGVITGIADVEYTIGVGYQSPSSGAPILNCGQRPFAYDDAGYKAICAANEPEPPVVKSTSAFVSATDTGASIEAALAAKRAGWPAWIEIFKLRNGLEGWRWRFSDDPTQYLDTASTNAKAAFPALGGTSYIAHALKVATLNGVATGTFTHVNGVADTVTDNLGNSRKAIILRRESAGGGDWFVYHPALTAGKLLYLNKTDAETTDASIGSVTANSFVAAAALPSGTYRWIGLADTEGFLGIDGYTGNGSTDGPFIPLGMLAALFIVKRVEVVGGSWAFHDNVRNPRNVANIASFADSAQAEYTSFTLDVDSGGVKVRDSVIDNVAGGKYITLSIAAFPSRYANAR